MTLRIENTLILRSVGVVLLKENVQRPKKAEQSAVVKQPGQLRRSKNEWKKTRSYTNAGK